ncbi:MAG: uncharacterized protein JWR62_2562 [Modestobacter sp.]|nr:uncharacterized protein [Modestobacter sp.]
MSRPSIVPIALTLDDRTGYTLWAPPWEEDGDEWQAFLGSTDEDAEDGPVARVHLFPSVDALAAFCRVNTDHDLADHPVWPVVTGLPPADLTPDEDHRYDLDGVYDIVAEAPDRWAVDELGAVLDMVGRLADCCDTSDDEDDDDGSFESVADLVARPEVATLGLGFDSFVGRSGEESWSRLGTAVDELWEDVLEELDEHLDWTGAGTVAVTDYPSAAEEAEARNPLPAGDDEDDDIELIEPTGGRPATAPPTAAPAEGGTSAIRGGSQITASPAAVAAAQEFWEAVGILPVELVVPGGTGLTLRCYVEDRARFLGRDGEVFLFPSPAELARFCTGDEAHDLTEIASWPEVADTDIPPLPADQDRYDLTELADVLGEVADGAGGMVAHQALLQPVEGARDLAEYGRLGKVEALLAPGTPLGQAVARAESEPTSTLRSEDAAVLAGAWDEVVAEVDRALVFRD